MSQRSSSTTTSPALAELTRELPPLLRDDAGPVFAAPWQAEVFAITLSLYEQGLFAWNEWAEVLATTIRQAQDDGDADLGDTYYLHWLTALEQMVVNKNLAQTTQLQALYAAWEHAAMTTPHGDPIELEAEDIAARLQNQQAAN